MTHEERRPSPPPSSAPAATLAGDPASGQLVSPSSFSPTFHNHLNNLTTMAAQSPSAQHGGGGGDGRSGGDEDYSLFLSENGHLSFENPNYQLDPTGRRVSANIDPARLDDHLNSNVQPCIPVSIYEELKQEFDTVCKYSKSGSGSGNSSDSEGKKSNRRAYASMDIGQMGVNVQEGPKTNLDNKLKDDDDEAETKEIKPSDKELLLQAGEIESDKLVESVREKADKSDGEEDTREAEGEVNEVVRRRPKKKKPTLPAGWERHEDADGPYFWHIKSGTIQREPPSAAHEHDEQDRSAAVVRDVRSSRIFEEDFDATAAAMAAAAAATPAASSGGGGGMSKSCTTNSIADLAKENQQQKELKEWKRRSMPPAKPADQATSAGAGDESKAMQVQVRSLGWVELREDELTPENSSKAVNRCIVQLSPLLDDTPLSFDDSGAPPPGQWGRGQELTMELNEGSLKLIVAESGELLHSQPIHSIRVWGVGRDNGRDFAYVARDKHTRKHMCHVFRCDRPARAIANALRDICKKILIERSLAQSSSKLAVGGGQQQQLQQQQLQQQQSLTSSTSSSASSTNSQHGHQHKRDRLRPTSLGSNFNAKLQTKTVPAPESFPTPMEEPKKTMRAWYLGSMQVDHPGGIHIIHGAIDHLMDTVPRAQWKTVSVGVAPSTVTLSFQPSSDLASLDCRVRFLSFLGIGQNVQQCAFIMHTAQDTFVCHVLHCEPTAGPLCKTIEAACKLRYQKCLDARPQRAAATGLGDAGGGAGGNGGAGNRSSIGATLKNMFGSWSKTSKLLTSPPPPGS